MLPLALAVLLAAASPSASDDAARPVAAPIPAPAFELRVVRPVLALEPPGALALDLDPAPHLASPPVPDPDMPEADLGPDLDLPEYSHRSVYQVGKSDLAVTAFGIAASIVPNRFARSLIDRTCPCDAADVNSFDRFAIGLHSKVADRVSDVTVALAVALPAVADTIRLGFGPVLNEDLMVLAETVSVNAAIVTGVKYLVQRPLPVTYAGRDGLAGQAQGYRSFYSGHTSTAVSALTAAAWTITLRDGPRAWPWVVVGVVGASVGVERVLAGRHFPTDVIVGAAAGAAVGSLVPLLHARTPPWGRGTLSLTPAGRGLALSGTF